MIPFFRFPSTPHLAWLAEATPRDDKVLAPSEVAELLRHELVVEEKVDGANLGLWVDEDGTLRAQNRGTLLAPGSHPQWGPLWPWLDARRDRLLERLPPQLIVFGEWCFARHTVSYTALPSWLLAFDVWDRSVRGFWSVPRRDALLTELELDVVPRVDRGHFDLPALIDLAQGHPSSLGAAELEGIVVRHDEGGLLRAKAKLVRGDFVAGIGEHWSHRHIEPNRIVSVASSDGRRSS
ncbi:MAG: RNA ligase family protein [Nannocystaceae bacterium]